MTTEVLVPSIGYGLIPVAPGFIQPCVLDPPFEAPPPQPDDIISTPVPPGVDFGSLPVIDPETQIIDTSPNQIIGCVNELIAGSEQETLDNFFPFAVSGDGVINRENNDTWKYNGTTWENVGPTPGPTLVVVSVLPPWDEIAIYDVTVRTRLQIQSFDYALALFTEPDPIGVVIGLAARALKAVPAPALTFALTTRTPQVSTGVRVNVPALALQLAQHEPLVLNTLPASRLALAANAPTVSAVVAVAAPLTSITLAAEPPFRVGSPFTDVSVPFVEFSVSSTAPTVATGTSVSPATLELEISAPVVRAIILPAIGDAFEGGFFAGYISHTADGNPTHALIVAPRETGATGTGYTLTTNLARKIANTTTAGTDSDFDGAVNTAAMFNAGIADHPAAQFCVNLSIGGFSDWYLPARLELDIAYENLKPATLSNRSGFGINDYSVPKRTVNRTAEDPAQTSIAAFQETGAEPFVADFHNASNEASATDQWIVSFGNGESNSSSKVIPGRVRAFRKIALPAGLPSAVAVDAPLTSITLAAEPPFRVGLAGTVVFMPFVGFSVSSTVPIVATGTSVSPATLELGILAVAPPAVGPPSTVVFMPFVEFSVSSTAPAIAAGTSVSPATLALGISAPVPRVFIAPTGGDSITDITIDSANYRVHAFTTTGTSTFTVNTGGVFDYVVVAGGGGGRHGPGGNFTPGGGGGAGGLIYVSDFFVESGTVSVVVGGGGAGGLGALPAADSTAPTRGENSSFGSEAAVGGGAGNGGLRDGGSGAGAIGNSSVVGSGTAGQGNDGGAGNGSPDFNAGGGGGAGAVGGAAVGNRAGAGGDGLDLRSVFGTGFGESGYFAGGGGGGIYQTGIVGRGGLGGGGFGGARAADGFPGGVNTGGGGGGGGTNNSTTGGQSNGGNGGSGVVLIRYRV